MECRTLARLDFSRVPLPAAMIAIAKRLAFITHHRLIVGLGTAAREMPLLSRGMVYAMKATFASGCNRPFCVQRFSSILKLAISASVASPSLQR